MKRILPSLALLSCAAVAQQAAPAFEVASIRVSPPPVGGRIMRSCGRPDPGMLHCTNATLKMLLVQAYGVKTYQIEGPAWLDTEQFDIDAKIPEGASKDVPAMLQTMLAERFKVALHKETKPLPVFELAVAKGGPKLKEVDPSELEKDAAAGRGAAPALPPPPPPPPGGGGGSGGGGGVVAMMVSAGPGGGGGGGARMTMTGNGATVVSGKMNMAQLIGMISRAVDRPIVDTTGLQGIYNIELTYLADNSPMMSEMRAMTAMAGGGGTGGDAHQPDASAPIATVFQAVKTLGLTLDPKKSPVEILVIDGANKVPTEN